ncbi:hypothetical protein DFH27DRAFT_542186 [Peziza echinospora]|nr:hypothetical protein DFH27DRAFT_542186 [Peziza echinospora]
MGWDFIDGKLIMSFFFFFSLFVVCVDTLELLFYSLFFVFPYFFFCFMIKFTLYSKTHI